MACGCVHAVIARSCMRGVDHQWSTGAEEEMETKGRGN
uniref:Uncharacterized protein n=1 Tax=Setaria italica TaxID=4555 RepID=K3Z222_SETIT